MKGKQWGIPKFHCFHQNIPRRYETRWNNTTCETFRHIWVVSLPISNIQQWHFHIFPTSTKCCRNISETYLLPSLLKQYTNTKFWSLSVLTPFVETNSLCALFGTSNCQGASVNCQIFGRTRVKEYVKTSKMKWHSKQINLDKRNIWKCSGYRFS